MDTQAIPLPTTTEAQARPGSQCTSAHGKWLGRLRLQSVMRHLLHRRVEVILDLSLLMFACTLKIELFVTFLVLAVAFPRLRREALFWVLVGAIVCVVLLYRWADADNHHFLFFYWTVAIALATSAPQNIQRCLLRTNARLLIGLAMALAVFWKTYSGSYLDGSFFHKAFLQFDRFQGMVCQFCGASPQMLIENRIRFEELKLPANSSDLVRTAQLTSTPGIGWASFLATWWTLGIEAFVAAVFLLPSDGRRIRFLRNASILVFLATTYVVAPVIGFAWILQVMAIAQLHDDDTSWAAVFVVVFAVICGGRMLCDGLASVGGLT